VIKNFILASVLLVTFTTNAKDMQRKLLSAWSTDCDNMEKSRWFALESHGTNKYMFTFCAATKCIPYPGFFEAFDVYHDKRVKWISENEMSVSNSDKDAGWKGKILFKRCIEY